MSTRNNDVFDDLDDEIIDDVEIEDDDEQDEDADEEIDLEDDEDIDDEEDDEGDDNDSSEGNNGDGADGEDNAVEVENRAMKQEIDALCAEMDYKGPNDIKKKLIWLRAQTSGKDATELEGDIERARTEAEQIQLAFANMAAADLAEIKKAYPNTENITNIQDIPNFLEWVRLRDSGVSAVDAYLVVNKKEILNSENKVASKKAMNASKQHLQSSMGKKVAETKITMDKATLEEWRDIFPNKSDKEIFTLYKNQIKRR